MQLFNVYYGGTLHQHIEEHAQPGVSDAHSITVDDGSQLAAIIGAGNHLINSRHHQAVDQPGPKLLVTAHSTDGRIEALELPGHPFAIAVQWHPEDRIQNSPCDLRLFRAFAAKLDA
jgi:gamma-glutamyl-gamma-aminobutyrate hydrolase PuuD